MKKISQYSLIFYSIVVLAFMSIALIFPTSASADVDPGTVQLQCQPLEVQNGTSTVAKNIRDFPACTSINVDELGFKIPSLGDLLTFVIRAFFVFAGLAALFYMLLGAFAWVTSGGDSEAVGAAQQKIQAAVVGMLIIVGVLAIIWTLEQVIFNRRICLGLSCPLTLPGIIEGTAGSVFCCTCIKEDGTMGAAADINAHTCMPDGKAKSK